MVVRIYCKGLCVTEIACSPRMDMYVHVHVHGHEHVHGHVHGRNSHTVIVCFVWDKLHMQYIYMYMSSPAPSTFLYLFYVGRKRVQYVIITSSQSVINLYILIMDVLSLSLPHTSAHTDIQRSSSLL